MKYLSAFTGIGGFEIAIHNIFPDAECVGYSEFDKAADETYLKNFPEHKGLNLGDIERLVFDIVGTKKNPKFVINEYRISLLPDFDLLVGGPSCQDLSIAKTDRQGLAGKKSRVFFAFLAIVKIKKPKYIFMENVASMSKENKKLISEYLEIEAETICSDLWTPQKRRRNYWFNWDLPTLPDGPGPRWPELVAWSSSNDYNEDGTHKKLRQRETRDGRANTLTTGKYCGSFSSKNYMKYTIRTPLSKEIIRPLTPRECERLQGFPDEWTFGVSETQRYKQIGNAVNVPTIEHILKGLK